MTNFDDILMRVSIRCILKSAGYYPSRNRMPCPIHNGKNPTSFSFTDHTFMCFRCLAKGGLLDLAELLFNCNRQTAMRLLCEIAGLPYDNQLKPSQVRRSAGTPTRPQNVSEDDWIEFVDAENKLEWLQLFRHALNTCLKLLRQAFRNGTVPPEVYYRKEQQYIYELEDNDTWLPAARYYYNQIRKKTRRYACSRTCL